MQEDFDITSFGNSYLKVKALRTIEKQVGSDDGPIVLDAKKAEKPTFEINPELDPDGANFMKQMIN